MRIETKFSVGDKCYVVHDGQIVSGTIQTIETSTFKNYHSKETTIVIYEISLVSGIITHAKQNQTFVSTSNALEYLKDNVIK